MAESGLYDTESEASSIAEGDDSDQDSLLSTDFAEADRVVSDDQLQGSSDVGSTAIQAAKAIEAAGENIPEPADAPPQPSSSSLEAQSTDHDWFSEQTPLLDAGPAPPDYAAATAWRIAEPTQEAIASDIAFIESRRPLKDYFTSLSPWSHLIKDRRWRKFMRRAAMWICFVQLAIVCVVFITVMVVREKVQRARQYDDHPLYNLDHLERYHQSTSDCQFGSYSDGAYWSIPAADVVDNGDLGLWEALSTGGQSSLRNGRITGRIELRPAPYWQSHRFEIWYHAATTKPWFAELPEIIVYPQGLQFKSPGVNTDSAAQLGTQQQRGSTTVAPKFCYDLWIRVYVAGGMENCELHTANLDIDIGHGLPPESGVFNWHLGVQNHTNVSLARGSIMALQLNSRSMRIETADGSLRGRFGFRDRLSLVSQSGFVSGTVYPSDNMTASAHLNRGPPAHNQDERGVRMLHTHSKSGATALKIDNIFLNDCDGLQSSHYSDSGSIDVYYGSMDNWQGNIDIKTSNGTIELYGKGVELLPNKGSENAATHVRAKRGDCKSTLRVETGSGDVEVSMQDVSR